MSAKAASRQQYLDETPRTRSGTSPSPARKTNSQRQTGQVKANDQDYSSDGVADNDVFGLPNSDFTILGVLIAVATVVRLFRIYQPNSVVFDEVQ